MSKIDQIIIVSKFYERSVTINLEFAFVCATPHFCNRHDDRLANKFTALARLVCGGNLSFFHAQNLLTIFLTRTSKQTLHTIL